MFKIGNFLFRREIIHYTGWQNLCRDESRTARSWQNLCREESGRRGAGRISAGKNPDGARLAESLPRGTHVDSDRHGVCPYMRGRINVGGGQQITPRNLSLHTGTNQCGYRTDSKSPLGVMSLHEGANQCGYRTDSKSPLGGLSAPSQSGKNNLTLYDMLIGIKLVENVKHICGKIDHCTVDKLIRYLVISLSNSPGYTGFSIGVAVAKHSYSDCVFKRV